MANDPNDRDPQQEIERTKQRVDDLEHYLDRLDKETPGIPHDFSLKESDSFGEMILKRIPEDVSLAKLSRAADIDYVHLHSVIKGKRNGKPARPSPELVFKIIESLHSLGAYISARDEVMIMNAAVELPEGWELNRVSDQQIDTKMITSPIDIMGVERLTDAYLTATILQKAAFDTMVTAVQETWKWDKEGVRARRAMLYQQDTNRAVREAEHLFDAGFEGLDDIADE